MKKLLNLCNEWIVAEVEAIEDVVLGEPDCILINPVTLDGQQWPPFSLDTEVVVRSSDIMVLVNPRDDVLKTNLTE
jgi:hypothetical protein